jgi:hypothetical protein
MTTLSIQIGQAERSTRALLDRALAGAGLTFAEWTAYVLLDGAGPLGADVLLERQLAGRVAPEPELRATLARMQADGLLAGDPLTITPAGAARFVPLRDRVAAISADVYRDLPAADLEAARRVLGEVARRAEAALAAA